jgi:hypothetical protein
MVDARGRADLRSARREQWREMRAHVTGIGDRTLRAAVVRTTLVMRPGALVCLAVLFSRNGQTKQPRSGGAPRDDMSL